MRVSRILATALATLAIAAAALADQSEQPKQEAQKEKQKAQAQEQQTQTEQQAPAGEKQQAQAQAQAQAGKSQQQAQAPKQAQQAPEAHASATEQQKHAYGAEMAPKLELAAVAVCTNVEDRQPVGESEVFTSDVGRLVCFTDVRNAQDAADIYHRWYINDEMINEIAMTVRGPRWRCWSEKTILPSWQGECRVEIVDEEGDVIGEAKFELDPSRGMPSMPEPAQPAQPDHSEAPESETSG